MADVNYTYSVDDCSTQIDLGIRGENLARGILFDVASWMTAYGTGGAFLLKVVPHGWTNCYPVTLTSYSSTDKTVGWDVDSAATAEAGSGELQLIYSIGDVVKSTASWRTYVHLSVTDSGLAPDPYASWAEQITVSVNQAIGYASTAATSAAAAQTSAANAATSAAEAEAVAEQVSEDIGEQVEEYISTHQSEIAALISEEALAAKLDKDDADVLAVLAKY